MQKNIMLLSDGYKLAHHVMYPEGTEIVFSNFTPRSSKHAPAGVAKNGVIVMGVRKMVTDLLAEFQEFFQKPFDESVGEMLSSYLSADYNVDHFRALHQSGVLPVSILAMPEGSFCPIGVPMLTIYNTDTKFYWITNFLETYISAHLWKAVTAATIAASYYTLGVKYFEETTGSSEGLEYNIHNFSARGMDSVDAIVQADLGHLLYFKGSDSLPTMLALKQYYGVTDHMVNIPASEHSVMCAGGKSTEYETYKTILEKYPTGYVSLVSDTWDLWNVITNILPALKQEIVSRDGRLVIRPDSGNPVDILCGLNSTHRDVSYLVESGQEVTPEIFEELLLDEVRGETPHGEMGVEEYTQRYVIQGSIYEATIHNISWNRYDKQYYYMDMWDNADITLNKVDDSPAEKGVVELLWDEFGGTVNEKGYKVLDTHIGVIYGDSITVARASEIYKRLKAKGFAASNVVLGIGSYTYQYNTRDTFGMAMKATYVEINGEGYPIFKEPVTDDGTKKSATGLLHVIRVAGAHGLSTPVLVENSTWKSVHSDSNMLKMVYSNVSPEAPAESWETICNRAKESAKRLIF